MPAPRPATATRVRAATLAAAAAMALGAGTLRAEDELLTDRPDFTETSVAVTPGRVQVEGGFTATERKDSGDWNAPEALARVGLMRGLELRMGADWGWAEPSPGSADAELYLGAKLQLLHGDGPWGLALIPALVTSLGGENDTDPEVFLAWSRDLAGSWGLGGILGFSFEGGGEDGTLGTTVSLARPLGGRVGAFLEWASETAGERTSALIHHGYTLGLGPDAQLDVHGGVGLDSGAPDWFVGAGFAFRR